MKKITIATSQNIAVDYEFASFLQRLLAFLLDIMVIGFFSFFTSAFVVPLFGEISMYFIVVPVVSFYTVGCESLMNGQTLGKKAMNIRVMNVNGKEADFIDYLLRWSFRLVDIYLTFGALATIMINSSAKAQRLGGMLSNTIVIRQQPKYDVSLRDILNLDDRVKYEPKYPAVTRFSEKEMLIVKSVLERIQIYPNQAHAMVLNETVNRCLEVMGINQQPANKVEFLKTLLKDYIVITRS